MCNVHEPPRRGRATAALPVPAEDDDDDDDEPEVVAPPTRKRKHSKWTCGACTFVNEGGRTCDVCGAARPTTRSARRRALRELAAHNAVPPPRPPPPTGDDTPEADGRHGRGRLRRPRTPPRSDRRRRRTTTTRPWPRSDSAPDDDDAEMADDAAMADDGGVAGLLRSMMVAEQTSRQESGAVVAVAACRDTVAVATARSISLLREGAADVRGAAVRVAGGSVVAVAVERRGDFLSCRVQFSGRRPAAGGLRLRSGSRSCEQGPKAIRGDEDAAAPRRGW